MKLSNRHDLAMGLLIQLDDKPTSLRAMAVTLNTSLSYLEPIAQKLRRAELVRACRGPGGGYVRVKPLEEIAVGEVLNLFQKKNKTRAGVLDRIIGRVTDLTLADVMQDCPQPENGEKKTSVVEFV